MKKAVAIITGSDNPHEWHIDGEQGEILEGFQGLRYKLPWAN